MAIGAVVVLCMWYDSGGVIYGLFMRCSDLPLHTMTVRQARPSKCHITSLIVLYSEVYIPTVIKHKHSTHMGIRNYRIMYEQRNMDVQLVPTPEQHVHMSKPWRPSLAALKTADFLGRQDYIDWWITRYWLVMPAVNSNELPLCVSESIHCDFKLKRRWRKAIRRAIVDENAEFMETHYIIPDPFVWNIVDFHTVSDKMFFALALHTDIPKRLSPFIVASQRLNFLEAFVDKHGPTLPLRDAICHQWAGAVAWLLSEGAEITGDCVGMAVRHARIFDLVTMYNPEAKQSDWEEFLLQCTLRRVPDVPRVEQWFYINGFRI